MNPQEITKQLIDELYRISIKDLSSSGKNCFLLPNILFDKFSKKDFIEVLKDPAWVKATNRYWMQWKINTEKDILKAEYKDKMSIVKILVEVLFRSGHPYANLVVKYSDGLLLGAALKVCKDVRLKKLSTRGLKSGSYRVRRIAVKSCPTSKLTSMLKDSRREVRAAAIERLGMHNVASKVIDDPSIDIRLGAAVCLERIDVIEDILEIETQKIQDTLSSKEDGYVPWTSQDRLMKIIPKLPKKQLLYNLDIKDAGCYVKSLVEAKLYEAQE